MTATRKRGRPRRFTRDKARLIRHQHKAEGVALTTLSATHGVTVATIRRVVKAEGSYTNT
jgi:hypothetical protein